MIARAVAIVLMTVATAQAKPGTPGPEYFTGIYERVGRTERSALLNDLIEILPDGQGVVLRDCRGETIRMGFGPAFEINNLMTGQKGRVAVECLFHNNGYNRAILTCRAKDGSAFTLWPTTRGALACGA